MLCCFCCFCKNPLKHNRSTSGTTHLRDHLTHCSKNPVNQHSQKATTSRPITAFFKSTQKLSQLDKKKLLDASVTFIAKNIRPFKAIGDHGFKNMAKCLVQLGAKYGNFDVNEALPSRHTVKRHAVQKADVKQNQIIDHLQSAIKANGYSLSVLPVFLAFSFSLLNDSFCFSDFSYISLVEFDAKLRWNIRVKSTKSRCTSVARPEKFAIDWRCQTPTVKRFSKESNGWFHMIPEYNSIVTSIYIFNNQVEVSKARQLSEVI